MLHTPDGIGPALFLHVDPVVGNSPPATPCAAFTSGLFDIARVTGSHGMVELAMEHESNFAWADLMSVGAFDHALVHLQHQFLGDRLSAGSATCDHEVRLMQGEVFTRVECCMPLQQLHVAQAMVRLAQASAAREAGANTGVSICVFRVPLWS